MAKVEGKIILPEDPNTLHLEFRKFAFGTLIRDFSEQVDSISDQQAAHQISWDEAISQISSLIQELRLKTKQLGLQPDSGSESSQIELRDKAAD